MKIQKQARHMRPWADIGFAVTTWKANNVVMGFEVVQIIGTTADGIAVYSQDQPNGSSGNTENMADADIFLSGSIKWDGCSDMNFDEQERVMLHFCSKGQAANVGVLMQRLYELAAELMPAYEDELS